MRVMADTIMTNTSNGTNMVIDIKTKVEKLLMNNMSIVKGLLMNNMLIVFGINIKTKPSIYF